MTYRVGDRGIYRTGARFGGNEPAEVVKVGRKYMYVARDGFQNTRHMWEKCDVESGVEVATVGAQGCFMTEIDVDRELRTIEVWASLKDWGLVSNWASSPNKPTLEQLEAIVAFLKQPSTSPLHELVP